MLVLKLNQKSITEAVSFLNKGGLVVFPTDTVYGILGNDKNKIFKIKKRPKSKPLGLFVKDLKMAISIAEIDKDKEKILKKHWPGKYTFILKDKKKTIGIRVPDFKPLNLLLKKVNKPIFQTSANISGKPSTGKIKEVIESFKNKDILIIDAGNLPKRKPSKVIDLTGAKRNILRK